MSLYVGGSLTVGVCPGVFGSRVVVPGGRDGVVPGVLLGLARLGHRDVHAEVDRPDAVEVATAAEKLVAHAELEAERDARPDHVLGDHAEEEPAREEVVALGAELLNREPDVEARHEPQLPQHPRLQNRRDVGPHHQQMHRVLIARAEQERRVRDVAADREPIAQQQRAGAKAEELHGPWHHAVGPEVRQREQVAVDVRHQLDLRRARVRA